MEIELTPALVRTYLASLAPGAICGVRGDPDNCPLARALCFAGARHPLVTWLGYIAALNHFPLPLWAKAFVEWLDKTWKRSLGVRAKTALRILDAVTADAQ